MHTILINDEEKEMKFTGYTCILYKEEFGRDFLGTVMNISNVLKKDSTSLFEVYYVLLKTADDSMPSFKEWMKSLNSIMDIMSESSQKALVSCLEDGLKTTKEPTSKKKK